MKGDAEKLWKIKKIFRFLNLLVLNLGEIKSISLATFILALTHIPKMLFADEEISVSTLPSVLPNPIVIFVSFSP